MLRTVQRGLLIVACIAILASVSQGEPLKALIVDGRNQHPWQTTTPILEQILESSGRFQVDVSTAPDRREPYGDWNPQFSSYDVVVSNFNDPDVWPEALRNQFIDYVRGGGG